jgi:hypothetical protein
MAAIHNALNLVRAFRRSYLTLNVLYYGLIAAAMVYAAFNRPLQQELMENVLSSFSQGPLAPVWNAYSGGQLLAAIVLTFVVNLLIGSFVTITLPSLVIPFSGLLQGVVRAVLWGLLFSPPTLEVSGAELIQGLLTFILLVMEGQAYVLTMLAATIQSQAFLFPQSVGTTSRRQGYRVGIKHSLHLYLLVVLQLAVAAIYEALVAIVVIPWLD